MIVLDAAGLVNRLGVSVGKAEREQLVSHRGAITNLLLPGSETSEILGRRGTAVKPGAQCLLLLAYKGIGMSSPPRWRLWPTFTAWSRVWEGVQVSRWRPRHPAYAVLP